MTDEVDASAPSVLSASVRRRSQTIGFSVAVLFFLLDQITKQIAETVLEPGRFVPWLGDHIGWQLVYNPGGAFGLPLPAWIFLVVTVVVVLVVSRALPRTASRLTASAYGLLLAGAAGNVIDRLVRAGPPDGPDLGGGAVIDFVAWGSFPRFNVADSAISVGFVLLVLALWREDRLAHAARKHDDPSAELDQEGDDRDDGHPDPEGSARHNDLNEIAGTDVSEGTQDLVDPTPGSTSQHSSGEDDRDDAANEP